MKDEFHGQGGRYEIRDGKRVRVREATKDHPEGNRARPLEEQKAPPASKSARAAAKGAD